MKNNVLHIINSSGNGGAESVVSEIIKLSKISVFCLRKDNVERFKLNSGKVYFGTSTSYYKLNPIILYKLIKIVKSNQINIVHIHLANSLVYGLIIKLFNNDVKIIYHEHGEIFYNKKLQMFLKIYSKYIDLIIAVSNSTKKALNEKASIPQDKIQVLYNFVDADRFNRKNIKININKEKEKLGINKEDYVIGFVGRLAKVKGCEYLIKALPNLDFKFKVIIAGDGPERRYLEELSKSLKVNDKVLFLGYRDDPENVYALMDVLIMPSLSEASPMAFYESQAMGLPIIGSNVSAINEFIIPNKNGLLFELKNHLDLSKKIKYLFTNKKLIKKMIHFSKESIKKHSLTNFLKSLNNIYKIL